MQLRFLELNRGVINIRKIFLIMVVFEAFFIWAVLFKDLIFLGTIIGIMIIPFFLLLIPLEPTIGVALMLLATGLDFLAVIVETSWSIKFDLTYFHVALLVTFVSILLNLLLKGRLSIPSVSLWPPLITFYLVLAISLIYTPNFIEGSWMFVRIVVMGLVALFVLKCLDKEWKVRFVIWSMVLIPLGVSVLSTYEMFSGGNFVTKEVQHIAATLHVHTFRSTSTFNNPNILACFLMIGVVIPFGMMFIKKYGSYIKIFLMFSIVLTSVGILSSFSRSGYLSTMVGIMVIVALHKKWSYFYIFLGAIIIVAVILSIQKPLLWQNVYYRFESIFNPFSDDSSSSRISLMRSGIWMWQDHPFLGVGLRGFPKYVYDYVDPNMPGVLVNIQDPHTIQTEILAEEGLLGFAIATWLFMTIFLHGIRTSFSLKNDFLRNAQIACIALFIGFVVNFTFGSDLVNNAFWITVGMIFAIPLVEKYGNYKSSDLTDNFSVLP